MKIPIYLRIAKTNSRKGYKVSASIMPINEPLTNGNSYNTEWFPTVYFGVSVDIPDEMFDQASTIIGELNVATKEAKITTEIVLPKGITLKKKKL